ncbi:hypothetical protein ACFQE1_00065 [Halobium palmae]|uniref:Uncharacterized protein n=1 Tax=Halobium palmae TaxID=1776492 RepID=A0ABD5RTY0_9EURY
MASDSSWLVVFSPASDRPVSELGEEVVVWSGSVVVVAQPERRVPAARALDKVRTVLLVGGIQRELLALNKLLL